ncbi:MAG: hypothetical protein UT11_C0057G0008 [Berkelbacteria bacterium GW2011_GWA2_38_9]|uniref:Glycosyl transferase family 9 n=1 Tax=Berkelbacteria bacterium GW2011_GWA2_38_9 TaxID=1618334 RepID=A0A0G0L7U8_9BACT|nr:MAG: hypothetical protein UT11_C0057G0008 [Berkelbacteria bacterium GW2011_GWA2_38_9]
MDYPQKILLILGAIGDTLMFTPTIEALHKAYPKAKVDALVFFGGSGAVLEKNEAISEIFVVPFLSQSKWQSLRSIKSIRRNRYDLSLLAIPDYRKEYHILAWLLGANKRLAHIYKSGYYKEMAFLETDLERMDYSAHNIENNLNLLNLLDIDWRKFVDLEKVRYTLNLKDEWKKEAEEYLKKFETLNSKYETNPKSQILNHKPKFKIGIHPGSTISPAALMRRWDPRRFAAVADHLIEKENAQVFIFAGPEEVDVGKKVQTLMKNPCILVDNLKLGPVMALMSKLDLFISNDSGLGHLAAGVGAPLVAIWGSTNPRYSCPINPGQVIILRKAKFPAWHWYENKRNIPKGCEKLSGMEDVEVEDVMAACKNYLK